MPKVPLSLRNQTDLDPVCPDVIDQAAMQHPKANPVAAYRLTADRIPLLQRELERGDRRVGVSLLPVAISE